MLHMLLMVLTKLVNREVRLSARRDPPLPQLKENQRRLVELLPKLVERKQLLEKKRRPLHLPLKDLPKLLPERNQLPSLLLLEKLALKLQLLVRKLQHLLRKDLLPVLQQRNLQLRNQLQSLNNNNLLPQSQYPNKTLTTLSLMLMFTLLMEAKIFMFTLKLMKFIMRYNTTNIAQSLCTRRLRLKLIILKMKFKKKINNQRLVKKTKTSQKKSRERLNQRESKISKWESKVVMIKVNNRRKRRSKKTTKKPKMTKNPKLKEKSQPAKLNISITRMLPLKAKNNRPLTNESTHNGSG